MVVMWTEELDKIAEPAYVVIRAEELEEVPRELGGSATL